MLLSGTTQVLISRASGLICPIASYLFIYLGVLRHFQHCTGHITTGSFLRAEETSTNSWSRYCKLPTIGKQLPTFPHKVRGLNRRPQRWEMTVLPLYHSGPSNCFLILNYHLLKDIKQDLSDLGKKCGFERKKTPPKKHSLNSFTFDN